jgi:hypothetical protein
MGKSSFAPYALVVTPLANLRARPDHRSELKSQRWHGELVEVRAQRDLWLKVASWDGYLGWVRFSSLRLLGARAARAWERAARKRTWVHTVLVRPSSSPGSGVLIALPWGSRLVALDQRGHLTRVRLADGRLGVVPTRELGPHKGSPSGADNGAGADIGRRAAALVRAVCGTPYLWGGTSSWGFDCSGLVQWAYALSGRALPRDACDQIQVTRPLAPWESARPGDLIFFGQGGEAGHVGLVTRPPRFVHAYSRVEEARLGRGSGARPELRAVCLGLRRPLGSLTIPWDSE